MSRPGERRAPERGRREARSGPDHPRPPSKQSRWRREDSAPCPVGLRPVSCPAAGGERSGARRGGRQRTARGPNGGWSGAALRPSSLARSGSPLRRGSARRLLLLLFLFSGFACGAAGRRSCSPAESQTRGSRGVSLSPPPHTPRSRPFPRASSRLLQPRSWLAKAAGGAQPLGSFPRLSPSRCRAQLAASSRHRARRGRRAPLRWVDRRGPGLALPSFSPPPDSLVFSSLKRWGHSLF